VDKETANHIILKVPFGIRELNSGSGMEKIGSRILSTLDLEWKKSDPG
jgi:hypothetical protein